MMQSDILDRTLLERMVTGFREQEAHVDGYEKKSCERGVSSAVWKLEYTATYNQDHHVGYMVFEDTKVLSFVWPHRLYESDMLKLTYTLSWYWEGGDGETYSVLPSGGGAGLELEMVFTLSA